MRPLMAGGAAGRGFDDRNEGDGIIALGAMKIRKELNEYVRGPAALYTLSPTRKVFV